MNQSYSNGNFTYTLINYCKSQVNSPITAVVLNQNPNTQNNSQFKCDSSGNNYLKIQIDTTNTKEKNNTKGKNDNLPYFYCGTSKY